LRAQRRRRDGTPWFLPVRVAYDGPLGYALGATLDRYQYAPLGAIAADDRQVLETLQAAIINAAAGLAERGKPKVEKGPEVTDVAVRPSSQLYVRPATAADPRVLRQPGGGMKLDDPCYPRAQHRSIGTCHGRCSGYHIGAQGIPPDRQNQPARALSCRLQTQEQKDRPKLTSSSSAIASWRIRRRQ